MPLIRTLIALIVFCLWMMPGLQAQSYPWPMAPMNQQHRISATFDECRENRDHFHNGTDIPLAAGGNVLNVEVGRVISIDPTGGDAYIRVGRFAYIHVDPDPALEAGDQVALGELVGQTNSQSHVHLKEGGGGSGAPVANSLRNNALTPFVDSYGQHIYSIDYYLDGPGARFATNEVYGPVDIVVRAGDTTDTQSSIDMNNGVYKIGYRIFADDQVTPVTPMQMSFVFDHLFNNNIINRVYAAGSSTSVYRYIVTNTENQDRYWDTTSLTPGQYWVGIFTFDTRANSDTTFFPVTVTEQDTTPPAPPTLSFVGEHDGALSIRWMDNSEPDLGGYRLYFSYDGEDWNISQHEDNLPPGDTIYQVPRFPLDSDIYFRVEAVDNAPLPNVSQYSDAYGVRLSESPGVLLVDDFQRVTGYWEQQAHSFLGQAGLILDSLGVGFHSMASPSLDTNDFTIMDYEVVIWLTGDNNTATGLLTDTERAIISEYLESGGNLFISGANLASGLGEYGSASDQQFLGTYMKAGYQATLSAFSSLQPTESGLFQSISDLEIDTLRYPLDSLGTLQPAGGAMASLEFESGETAALQYAGAFGNSAIAGKLVLSAVPPMIMEGRSGRGAVFSSVLAYFGLVTTGTVENSLSSVPERFSISNVYPNPFNPRVHFRISGAHSARLVTKVYDLSGRVVHQGESTLAAGTQIYSWDGTTQPSGVYFMAITLTKPESGEVILRRTHKLLLLK